MRLFISAAAALLLAVATPASADQEPARIVVDMDSGTVLAHQDAGKLWYPASVTKLMTAYVTFRAIKSGEVDAGTRVVVSRNALKEPPSKMGYKAGTDMTLDNAMKMMIVRSANDIAVAIAETVGGSEAGFVKRMNGEARRLGMASTVYRNPNGLPDDGQVTTARDLAVLARAIWVEFPEYRELFRIPAIKAGRKILRSQNTLLERFRGANGMKTGFICASGFNIVATATRSGRTLAVVVLGAESAEDRGELAAKLLQDGFKPKIFGNRASLASFRSAKAPGRAVNMRAQVCGKRQKQEGEDLLFAKASPNSALGPRFVLMDPVLVSTGVTGSKVKPTKARAIGAKQVGAEQVGAEQVGVPIPRPRPSMSGDSAGLRFLIEEDLAQSPAAPASTQGVQ